MNRLHYFLVHPGGPLFRRKDDGAWTVPKGLVDPEEDLFAAAKRELGEETGFALPGGPYAELGHIVQKSGKHVHAWAVVADFDPHALKSNTFEMSWPPKSGRTQSFPEVDRGEWFDREAAERKIIAAQVPFLDRVEEASVRARLGLVG